MTILVVLLFYFVIRIVKRSIKLGNEYSEYHDEVMRTPLWYWYKYNAPDPKRTSTAPKSGTRDE
jgi:hypothetical protein